VRTLSTKLQFNFRYVKGRPVDLMTVNSLSSKSYLSPELPSKFYYLAMVPEKVAFSISSHS
jgi:hypothetical protein